MKTTTATPKVRSTLLGSRPFVSVNMAMTADGKIATANRAVSSFGSQRDQEHLYELRTTVDAVMAGARTLDLNEVFLGNGGERFTAMRLRGGRREYPLRVIVSGAGTIDPRAAVFRRHFSPIIVLTTQHGRGTLLKTLRRPVDDIVICGKREISFPAAFRHLRKKWGVRRLLCEGGGELNAALFRENLVDELNLTICPKIMGGRRAPTIAEGSVSPRLLDAARFRLQSFRQIGFELFLVYRSKTA